MEYILFNGYQRYGKSHAYNQFVIKHQAIDTTFKLISDEVIKD